MTLVRATIWSRSIAIWLLIAIAESVHGTLRQLYLAPLIGDFRARQISVFTAIGLIFVIALLTIRWLHARDNKTLLRVGALWVTLTIIFEVSLGRALGFEWSRIFEDYDLSKGGLMILGILAMLFMPLVAARARGV